MSAEWIETERFCKDCGAEPVRSGMTVTADTRCERCYWERCEQINDTLAASWGRKWRGYRGRAKLPADVGRDGLMLVSFEEEG